ncbi:hypothetical protein Goari_017808 [Gossypium aridum]|uniref:Uncharacterized protein n=1 Tax=Gossypium aridum TaxID=34290 RepID=A0A7J8WP14_GOSAI|nr:hypothetical protein [Gossypium aridum]
MEKGFFDKVEDKAAIRIWSEKTQQEKGGSLMKGLGTHRRRVHNSGHCPRKQADKAYSRAANVLTFLKRLMSITGMSEQ